MIYAGTETIETLMLGEMGIKTIMAGSENVMKGQGPMYISNLTQRRVSNGKLF